MKKVLIIQNILPHYRKDFFDRLKNELTTHNIELEFLHGIAHGTTALKKDECKIEWAHIIKNRYLKIGKKELIWQPILKYLNDKDLVIVEAANLNISNYILLITRYFSKYKLAAWGHGRNFKEAEDSISNRFKYLFINKFDWWFAYTKGVKDLLITKGVNENKITDVQNAIETTNLSKFYSEISEVEIIELKNELGIKGSKTAIFCGGMYANKRLDFLLETCLRVKKEIPEFHMIFVGAGLESHKIQEASKKNNWIHYVGPKFSKDRVKYFKISSIQLMPGIVGLGILDSFALETPIVTTTFPYHSPEIEYLENGINGFKTNNNLTEYSDTIIDILNNERHLDIIQNCRSSAKKYSIDNMVNNFKIGILNCLNG